MLYLDGWEDYSGDRLIAFSINEGFINKNAKEGTDAVMAAANFEAFDSSGRFSEKASTIEEIADSEEFPLYRVQEALSALVAQQMLYSDYDKTQGAKILGSKQQPGSSLKPYWDVYTEESSLADFLEENLLESYRDMKALDVIMALNWIAVSSACILLEKVKEWDEYSQKGISLDNS